MSIIRFILFLIHLVVLFLLLGTKLNAHILPERAGWLNLLSLGFPVLLIFYFILSIFWLITFKKRGIIFLLGWIFLLTPTQRWLNYSSQKEKPIDFKLICYNTKGISDEKAAFLNHEEADILMLQEAGGDSKMKLSNFKYDAHTQLISIYSKFPIISQKVIPLTDIGAAQYADIQIKDKTIRFINIYLSPFKLDKSMVKPSKSVEINEIKAKSLVSKLIPVFKIHQKQIQKIKPIIENSPYPIILAGDFNAVPNSYEYFQLSENLIDSFLEAGTGSGTSFHDYKFPIRIDYVFSSENIIPINHKTNREVTLSDHYPIYTEFHLK